MLKNLLLRFMSPATKEPQPAAPAANPEPVPPTPASPEQRLVQNGRMKSIIGNGMTVNGAVVLENQGGKIDGKVNGDVVMRGNALLVVGHTAVINGSVTGHNVIVAGTITGDLAAVKTILLPTARVQGAAHYHTITMNNGASVMGGLVHMDRAAVAKKFNLITPAGAAPAEPVALKQA